jgi:hypothetical protein
MISLQLQGGTATRCQTFNSLWPAPVLSMFVCNFSSILIEFNGFTDFMMNASRLDNLNVVLNYMNGPSWLSTPYVL